MTLGVAWLDIVDEVEPDDWPDGIRRANGLVVCETCGKTFDRHRQPAKKTCPTLVVLCDGLWVKT